MSKRPVAKNQSRHSATSRSRASSARPRIRTIVNSNTTRVSSPPPIESIRELPGMDEEPVGPDDSWRRIAVARSQAFDHGGPAYLLDDNYFFLDWNTAFDVLVAGPLGLKRIQSHAGDFVAELKNAAEVVERSRQVFARGRAPQLDQEKLIFDSKPYGHIEFDKLAIQVYDPNVELAAWAVYLNISRADQATAIWKDIGLRLEKELHWARYALSYDRLLLEFDDYGELLSNIVGRLKDCRRCLDLGSGTGNGTLALLQSWHEREVWAVESNHSMVVQSVDKIARAERKDLRNYFGRLRILKEDIQRLDELVKANLLPGDFDGAMLCNVLYTLDDPGRGLKAIARCLRPGGRLVLSTPHSTTDVGALFERMRDVLEQRGVFDKLRPFYEDAKQRNLDMIEKIQSDSVAKIEAYVTSAGFRLANQPVPAYADAVLIFEAVKR